MTTCSPPDVPVALLDYHTNGDASDDNFDRNEELIAALEYRLGLNTDVYAISDVLEITAAALRRRLRSFERPTEEALEQRRDGEPPHSGRPQNALSSASDAGGTPAGNLGRRRLDDALMLFLLLQERQQESVRPNPDERTEDEDSAPATGE